MTLHVSLVGLGYWGPNLARSLSQSKGAVLHTICDFDSRRLAQMSAQYPTACPTTDFSRLLESPDIDAVVIATPPATHFPLAKAALDAGKSVMVEKPLAMTSEHCRHLIAIAEAAGLTLMVGHIFLYNAAVIRIKELIDSGALGKIYYVYAQRLNLGRIRNDVNALWNFGPHDLSILSYWLNAQPQRVVARGYSYVQPDIEDVVFMTLDYPGHVGANVHISWLDPHKVRKMTVVGSEKMVVYDDVNAEARLTIFDKGFTKTAAADDASQSLGDYATFGEFQLLSRAGDILVPKLEFVEPLKLECQHFVDCVLSRSRPLTDGWEGLHVVSALEAAQTALRENRPVSIGTISS